MDKLSGLWNRYLRRTRKIHVQWAEDAIALMRSLDPSLSGDQRTLAMICIALQYLGQKSQLEKRRETYSTRLVARLRDRGNR